MKKSLQVIASSLMAAALLVGCAATPTTPTTPPAEPAFKDGTYEGEGEGYKGPIKVEVVVTGGEITAVEVLENEDTPELFEGAQEAIVEEVIAENSADDLEVVTGATGSSEGLIEAIKDALEKAK
ncbi:MAG TPA: FMN-binding protein [Clostridiaceae bacterium]|nr:FMN-binding protein [Clostridiaceae bacterium]